MDDNLSFARFPASRGVSIVGPSRYAVTTKVGRPTANMCGSLPAGQKFAVMTAQSDNGESVPSNEIPFALVVGGSLGIAVPAR